MRRPPTALSGHRGQRPGPRRGAPSKTPARLGTALLGWVCLASLLLPAAAWSQSGGKVCVDPEKPDKCFPTIQEGVDAGLPGQKVTIVEGNYEENVVVDKEAMILQGAGADKTVIRAPGGGNGITLTAADITVRDIGVRGASGAAGIVISVGADTARIRDVIVSNILKSGTNTGDCVRMLSRRARIEKSVIQNCGGDGIQVGNPIDRGVLFVRDCQQSGDIGARQNEILKNTIQGCGEDCIQACGDETLIKDNTIARSGVTEAFAGPNPSPPPNTIFRGSGHCVNAVGYGPIVSGNEVSLCTFDGIRIEGDRATVDGNEVSSTSTHGIRFLCPQAPGTPETPQCEVSEIRDNQIENAKGDGIFVSGSVKAPPASLTIEKNFLTSIGLNGVHLSGNNYTVRKNRVREVGSNFALTPNNTLDFSNTYTPGGSCYLVEGNTNLLEKNSAEGCYEAGFRVDGDENLVSGNTAKETGTAGFAVGGAAAAAQRLVDDNVFEGNSAKKNGIYGFRVNGITVGENFFGAMDTTLEGNKGKKNGRADLCDAGDDTVLTDNKFKVVGEERTALGNCLAF